VEHCLAIVSYGFAEATENFRNASVTLHTLTDFGAIWQILKTTTDAQTISEVEAWQTAPHEWRKL
jgi:orotate phosphoribosyltransferase